MRIPKLKKNQPIYVEWIDAYADTSWQEEGEARQRPDIDCQTLGFYLKHNEELLWLSATISGHKKIQRDSIIIPVGCLKKIKKIDI